MHSSPNQGHRTRTGQERRARTQARILAAAVRVFATRDPHALVIEDFIRAAGISRGTFYNYFRSVDEVFEAASRWLEDDLIVSIEAELAALSDPVDRLVTGIRLWMKKAESDREWCAFVAGSGARGEKVEQSLTGDLHGSRDAGALEFPSVAVARDLVVGTLREAMVRMTRERVEPGYPEEVARLVLRGLGLDAREIAARMARPLPAMRRPSRTVS
jgi:AcrR family transcriptional regulator